jgi:hypothetical protein
MEQLLIDSNKLRSISDSTFKVALQCFNKLSTLQYYSESELLQHLESSMSKSLEIAVSATRAFEEVSVANRFQRLPIKILE